MKSEDQLAQTCSYLMFSTNLASLSFFGFVSFVFILGIYFCHRKFNVTSVIKIYTKMQKLWVHLDSDHLYIPLTSKQDKFSHKATFFLEIATLFLLVILLWGSRLKHQYFSFGFSLPRVNKLKENYFTTRKILQNFEGHDHWLCRHITFWVIYKFSKSVK